MAEHTHGYCLRCAHDVEIERRHSASLRRWVRAYLYMPVVLVPAFPFLAWDYVVCLPVLMLYMLGIGPVLMIIREPAVCCECGAIVDGTLDAAMPKHAHVSSH